MILSHRAPPSLNMSSYRAIWTHFRQNFIFFEQKISDPGPKILVLEQKIPDPGPKILVLGPQNCFYWGAAAPQTPCCSCGASSPPDPLAGACSAPRPLAQFLRGSASQALCFFLVPRSGWVRRFEPEPPNLFFSKRFEPFDRYEVSTASGKLYYEVVLGQRCRFTQIGCQL